MYGISRHGVKVGVVLGKCEFGEMFFLVKLKRNAENIETAGGVFRKNRFFSITY